MREKGGVAGKRETLSRQGQKSVAQPFKAGYASPLKSQSRRDGRCPEFVSLGLKPSGKSAVPAGTRGFLSHAFPALKRWAKLFRPARRGLGCRGFGVS